jgi:hypothetical protein
MPSGKQYVPVKNNVFYPWQGNFVNLVVLNKVAWGIPDGAVTALVNRRAEYEPLYLKAQNKTTRNRTDVLNHQEMRETYEKEIRAFVKKYCDTLPNSAKSDLGLTIPDTEPSPHPVITDVPYVKLKAIGGAEIEIRCRTEKDRTMPSLLKAASHIEYRYTMLEVGDIPPSDADDYPKKDVSSRAKFIVTLGTKNTGKRLFGVFRWVNMRKPKQEGPWTEAISVVIA